MPASVKFSLAIEHIAMRLPDYEVQRRGLFRRIEHFILRGIYLDRSQEKDHAYVQVFFWPLCVPTDALPFSYGFRVADRDGRHLWDLGDAVRFERMGGLAAQQTEAYHLEVSTPARAAKLLISKHGYTQPQVLEAIGVMQAWAGNHAAAIKSLDRISGLGLTPRHAHEHDFYHRVDQLRHLLRTDVDAARVELERRGRRSVANLMLDRLLDD